MTEDSRTRAAATEPAGGTLYVVATPIGNRDDITLRALRILGSVCLVAAEDTRRTGMLLRHHGIRARLVSYYSHNRFRRLGELMEALGRGESVALVTDAGTPGISDPGGVLVARALEGGYGVVPVPGPCAAVAALSASGLPADSFLYLGFLSSKRGRRRRQLGELAASSTTVIIYEAPHRIAETVADMLELFGPERTVCIARELTKRFEEALRGPLGDVAERVSAREPKGEYTIIIAPAEGTHT